MIDVISLTSTKNYRPDMSAYIELIGVSRCASAEAWGNYIGQSTVMRTYDFDKWNRNLDAMRQLQDGWNGYGAPAPSNAAIVIARSFLSNQRIARPFRVAPSAAGGVGITHKRNKRRVYVEFYNNGEVCALFSDDSSAPEVETIKPYAIQFEQLAKRIREFLDE
jgi:hypothetical protein